jgi:HEAT repeat protein
MYGLLQIPLQRHLPMIKPETTSEKISNSFSKIRSQEDRWEGVLEIKNIQDLEGINDLLHATKDDFWMIRWVTLEKLEQLQDSSAIDALLNMLNDSDLTVRHAVPKAIYACAKNNIKPLLRRCCDEDDVVFKFVKSYLQRNLLAHYTQVELLILYENSLVSNYLLLMVFKQLKEKSESLLMKAVKIRNTQRHAIMMLAIINSKKAIPIFIALYENAHLKRHIIQAFLEIQDKNKFNILIEHHKIKEIKVLVEQMIIKLSDNIVPTIMTYLESNQYQGFLLNILYKIPIDSNLQQFILKKVETNTLLKNSIDVTQLKPK